MMYAIKIGGEQFSSNIKILICIRQQESKKEKNNIKNRLHYKDNNSHLHKKDDGLAYCGKTCKIYR